VTNFLLVKIEKDGITSSAVKKMLIRKRIFIRDCTNFRGFNKKFIRVAVRTRKENLKLINGLMSIFGKTGGKR